MDEDSNSSMKDITSLMPNVSKMVLAATNVTPLASYSDKTNKQDGSGPMEIEDEDTSRSPKRYKIETEGKLVQNVAEDKYEQETMTT